MAGDTAVDRDRVGRSRVGAVGLDGDEVGLGVWYSLDEESEELISA